MSLSAAEKPVRRRFTADEVLRMVDAGILSDDDHLELVDGELVLMSPQSPRHGSLTAHLRRLLEGLFGPEFHARDHSPVATGVDGLPEPDLALVRGEPRSWSERHPTGHDVALVVEIAVTSHAWDRHKASVYARAGIVEYWLVDVPGRRLVVYRDPDPERAEYAVVRTLSDADAVEVAGVRVPVRDILA